MMSVVFYAVHMGIEMRLHLIDGPALVSILQMDWKDFLSKMEDTKKKMALKSERQRVQQSIDEETNKRPNEPVEAAEPLK